MNARKILLVAYQCGPGMGSVSQIGWEWYARLSADNGVTLVTHVRNRAALEQAGAPLGDSRIIYIDTEWFAGPLYRIARRLFPRSEHSVFLLSSADYFVFDLAAYRRLRRLRADGANWAVLHRVTPVTLAAPTWLGRLGLPTVIGPLNSGMEDPQGFGDIMKQESTWLIKLRRLGRLFDAALGSTRRVARILTATRTTLQAVAPRYRGRCRMMLENGVDLNRFRAAPWPPGPGAEASLRVLFAGRLIPLKGVDLLLQAVARLRRRGCAVRLDIVGDGPMREDWRSLARQLGLEADVCFHGALALDAVAERMRACHVFCLPSVRESGGAVLLEAMATGRPVIALDFGGPGEIVTDAVGSLLPLTSPTQVIDDLARTLQDVAAAPAAWQQRGRNGRREVEKRHSWAAKIAAAEDTYRELLAERSLSCC